MCFVCEHIARGCAVTLGGARTTIIRAGYRAVNTLPVYTVTDWCVFVCVCVCVCVIVS